jgi:tetratricopeptide (TPR) repeat protein
LHSLRPPRSLLLILVLVFGVFAPSLANGFAMDDVPLAQSVDFSMDPKGVPDEVIHGWRAPWWYFGKRYWEGTPNNSVLYRPVTVLSFAWTYNSVSGPFFRQEREALPHHLLNVLLHCFAVYLVWWMVRDLKLPSFSALACAALFGLHAIHSEVVAGIVGRAELLSFIFGLWGTLVFVRGRTIAAGLLLFLAFCSKESALAWAPFLPCYLLARRWLDGGSCTLAEVLQPEARRIAVVLGVALLLFFVVRYVGIRDVTGDALFSYDQNPLAHVTVGVRLLTAVKLLGYGFVKCLAPFWLYSLYGPGAVTIVDSAADPGFLGAIVGLTGWLIAGLWFAKRVPLLFLSMAAFLGFSFITSNLPLVIGTVFGERLFYMPSLGVCLLPILLADLLPDRGRRTLLVMLAAWAAVSAVVIVARNGAWKDSATLFIGDADRLPESADLQAKAGYMYRDVRRDSDRALEYFTRCVDRDPEFAGTWASIARIWGGERKNLKLAEKYYKRALDSKYIESSGAEDRTIQDYLMVLITSKQLTKAGAYASQVLARKPAHLFALIAAVDYCGRQTGSARGKFVENAVRLEPQNPDFVLLHAMVRYESTGARDLRQSEQIATKLAWALPKAHFGVLSAETRLRSRLYLGDTLKSIGKNRDALAVFEHLLADESIVGETRAQIESTVRELRK